MSLRMRAVMMSIPLDSWVTMQLWGSNAMCYPTDAAGPPSFTLQRSPGPERCPAYSTNSA